MYFCKKIQIKTIMKIIKKIIIIVLTPLVFVSCSSMSLLPVNVEKHSSLEKYTYFFITPTETKTSSGGVQVINGHVYGSSTKSTNPSDIISGYLIKRGMVRLPEIKNDIADKTIIINYGETGRRNTSIWGAYAIEVTLQVLSAKTNEVICIVAGEGQGETEADDIRIAIIRCLEEMYKQ